MIAWFAHTVNPTRNTGGIAKRLRAVDVPVTKVYFDNIDHTILIAAMARPLRGLVPVLEAVERFVGSNGARLSKATPAAASISSAPR